MNEWKKRLEINKKKILEINNTIGDFCGIYMFYKKNNKGEVDAYIGQSVNMLTRCASHLSGWKSKNPTHIDLSLKKWGLESFENPQGWNIAMVCRCDKENLDSFEKQYIKKYKDLGLNIYNITGGGQLEKEKDINVRNLPNIKRYRSGKEYGYNQCKQELRDYFEKYLDYCIKEPTNKVKERKLQDFKEFLWN